MSVHFSKKSGCLSSASPDILAFGSHRSAKFQPIFDCVMPNVMLKSEDSENIKADRVDIVVFKLYQIKQRIVTLENSTSPHALKVVRNKKSKFFSHRYLI